MYVEASTGSAGDKTTLTSTYFYRQTHSQCLTFWYHMYGASIGTLNVYSTSFFLKRLVWTKSGSQGNLWRKAQVLYQLNSIFSLEVGCKHSSTLLSSEREEVLFWRDAALSSVLIPWFFRSLITIGLYFFLFLSDTIKSRFLQRNKCHF